ncbi:MAG: hypothetical protein ABSA45_08550 [Verrucomicrobiota bacterium]|jgi:hypothetical protein
MKTALLEHIEAKIINFLLDTKAPSHASQIALQIQETREDTLQAIQKLVRSRTMRAIQDFTLFTSTGETVAYTLTNPSPTPTPSVPFIPPARLTPPASRGSVPGR